MPKYEVLSREIAEQIQKARQGAIQSPMAFDDGQVLRRIDLAKDFATTARTPKSEVPFAAQSREEPMP